MVLTGVALFTLGSVIAAVSGTIGMLIAGRLVQAAGGACGLALARTIARDVYGTDGLVRAMAYLHMAYALTPMLAPPLVGFLVDVSGWRAVMGTSVTAGIVIGLLMVFAVPDTQSTGTMSGTRRSVLSDYAALFGNLRYSAFVFQACGSSGVFSQWRLGPRS